MWKPLIVNGKTFSEYEISNGGIIKRVSAPYGRAKIGKIRKPVLGGGRGGKKYSQVVLSSKGIHTTCRVHRAVLETFIGPPEGREINHKDGNKLNNNLSNLEYCTRQENVSHAIRNKLIDFKGGNHPMARLNETQALEIKKLLKKSNLSQWAIAKKYGISQTQVWKIKKGIRWSHLS